MVATGGDTGTVTSADQRSVFCATDESTKNNESTTSAELVDYVNNTESTFDCPETSGTTQSPPQNESQNSQELCASRSATTRSSLELSADANIVSNKDSNSVTRNSSSNTRRKLSKQDNVNEQCSPIFIEGIEEIYLVPTTCSGSALSSKSKFGGEFPTPTNTAESKFQGNRTWVTTTIADVESRPGTQVPLESHSYDNFVPSRARQLVRSVALCGDDDTRLRPPRPVVKSFASMRSFGFPAQSSRNSSSVSRESSYTDYVSDLGEMELRSFIAATLHKNPRDRAFILEIEQIFTDFISNFGEQSIKLPPVSSYNRMIIHRIAVLFGLDHNVDNSGKCVVVSKTCRTKQPDFVFASLIQSNIFTDGRRFYPASLDYREFVTGELARRAQSFEIGCVLPNMESDLSQQPHPWSTINQRSFDNQHCPYYVSFTNHGQMMKKAGSFSGIPTSYQASHGFLESHGGSQNTLAALITAHEPIDETMDRFTNVSISENVSEISHCSSSIPPIHSGMYPGYTQLVQFPLGEEVICVPAPYPEQVLVQPTSIMTPSSLEMFSSHPAIMLPVQSNPSVQHTIPTMPCQQQEHLNNDGASQDQVAHVMPLLPGYINYHVHQHSSQIGDCYTQSYQSFIQPAFPTQCQQVVFHQQHGRFIQQPLIHAQQPYMQPQHYPVASIQSINHSQYHQHLIHLQVQSHNRYMSAQPLLQGHSHLYDQQQLKQAHSGAIELTRRPHYPETLKAGQPSSHGHVAAGQWSTGEQYQECTNEARMCNLDTQRSEIQVAPTPHILPTQAQTGRAPLNPLSVYPAYPEPMYHYSQISPAMSSMQQQQVQQVQCHPRPVLCKPTPYFGRQITSIDGGYCSMNQESSREDDIAATDVN